MATANGSKIRTQYRQIRKPQNHLVDNDGTSAPAQDCQVIRRYQFNIIFHIIYYNPPGDKNSNLILA